MATRKAKTGGPTTKGDKVRTRSKLTKDERDARDLAIAQSKEQPKLTPRQIKLRKARRDKRAAERAKHGVTTKCEGTNLVGEPCGAPPLRPGTEIDGTVVTGRWCLRHDADLPEDAWRRFMQEPGTEAAVRARSRLRRPHEILADALERAPALMFKPYFDALGVRLDEETGELVRVNSGAKIIGFSREGVARKSKYADVELQMKAAERLQDRIFGKPRQAMDLGFGGGGAAVVIPTTPERNNSVAKVLIECGALPDPAGDEGGGS